MQKLLKNLELIGERTLGRPGLKQERRAPLNLRRPALSGRVSNHRVSQSRVEHHTPNTDFERHSRGLLFADDFDVGIFLKVERLPIDERVGPRGD